MWRAYARHFFEIIFFPFAYHKSSSNLEKEKIILYIKRATLLKQGSAIARLKNIVLESFFYFQLLPLKEKWKELAGIANENGTYLLSEDSFIELLKFLIDNIEFLSDEVIIEVEKDNIKILDINENPIAEKEQISDFDLVDYLFKSSPRKINWSGEKRLLFLEKIFAKRIVYTNSLKEEKSIVQNFNFQKNL